MNRVVNKSNRIQDHPILFIFSHLIISKFSKAVCSQIVDSDIAPTIDIGIEGMNFHHHFIKNLLSIILFLFSHLIISKFTKTVCSQVVDSCIAPTITNAVESEIPSPLYENSSFCGNSNTSGLQIFHDRFPIHSGIESATEILFENLRSDLLSVSLSALEMCDM